MPKLPLTKCEKQLALYYIIVVRPQTFRVATSSAQYLQDGFGMWDSFSLPELWRERFIYISYLSAVSNIMEKLFDITALSIIWQKIQKNWTVNVLIPQFQQIIMSKHLCHVKSCCDQYIYIHIVYLNYGWST